MMKNLSDIIGEWLSKYQKGDISLCELLQAAFYHITIRPEDTARILAALQKHPDPDVQSITADINSLLRDRENRM